MEGFYLVKHTALVYVLFVCVYDFPPLPPPFLSASIIQLFIVLFYNERCLDQMKMAGLMVLKKAMQVLFS
jgi:hypothetical protein